MIKIFLLVWIFLSTNIFAYKEPESVKKHFKVPRITVKTPSLMRSSGFMSKKEMFDFIGKIHYGGEHTIVDLLGPTKGGNFIPLVVICKNKKYDPKKPTVMLFAQQHGDEPMGADVLVATIKRVARGDLKYLLNRINIVVLPRLNPDGAKRGERFTYTKKDMNSDHTALETREAYYLKKVFNRYKGDVVVDIHEYIADGHSYSGIVDDGVVPYYDLLFLSSTNPNYSERLKRYAYDKVLKDVQNRCKKEGYANYYYYNPFRKPKNGNPMILYAASGTPNIARNSYALNGALSFLIELRGKGIGRENIERRLESGVLAVEEFLKSTYRNSKEIKSLVTRERKRIEKDIDVRWTFAKKEGGLPLINRRTGKISRVKTINFVPKDSIILLKRDMPTAYVIKSDQERAIKVLKDHNIKVLQVERDLKVDLEEYIVISKKGERIETKLRKIRKSVKRGDYVVPVNQESSRYIATLLEPEGNSSFFRKNIIKIERGKVPIYRYHGKI